MLTRNNKTMLWQLVFSTGSRTSPLILLLWYLYYFKKPPQLNKAEVKTLQVCWSMQVLLSPTRNKNVKRESCILITTKTNRKSGPTWSICFRLQKEWRNVTFFKQRKTYMPDETRLSEYFGLCPDLAKMHSMWELEDVVFNKR